MRHFLLIVIGVAMLLSSAWGQQGAQTGHAAASAQAQIAECLSALPPEPKAPKPRGKSLFPGLQKKLDDAIKKAGGDPDAMRAQADQVMKDKYQAEEQEYQKKRSACSALVIAPASTEQASPSVISVTPPAEAKPLAPAPVSSKPILSVDGKHLYVCPKGAVNSPDGLPVCKMPDGGYVPLQEIPIPAGAVPPTAASKSDTAKADASSSH